ncbi:MAG: FesM [Acidobacteria bacterium]|nr:FesM [Acidobacteriota bacterium]
MDLLRTPVVGPFLRWRHARTAVQLVFLALAVVVVLHGLFGPDLASTNFATLLTWVHYRGLLVIALLAAGNIFCAGCPFVRVRDWGRLLHVPRRLWPAWLRGKWIALLLFVAVLFSYELFDLWALPAATAWLVLGYFAAAFAVDLVFKGATFCKHLCPVGQFNFLASTASPLEVQVRDRATCTSCRTADCVAGRRLAPASPVVLQRGCELGLFLPAKVGNLDCTFCLDCVHACPHDNVAVATRVPALELIDPSRRSAIGRIVDRTDIVVLVTLFVFGALLNAAAMIAPVYAVRGWASDALGGASDAVVLGLLFLAGLVVVPAVLLWSAAMVTRVLAGATCSTGSIVRRLVYGFVPFGFGVWLAHYSFHLLTGALVVVPVTQSAVFDLLGWPAFGEPRWLWTGLRAGAVFPIQIGFVLLGALGSVAATQSIAQRDFDARAGRAALPWLVVLAVLTAAAVWMLSQPMEMRGMGL